MEVILLQKVANVGNIGDRVKVKSGFGRNYLLPSGKATLATPAHVAAFEARLIEQTLKRCQGNKSKAARLLGLRPNTLHYKLERYGLGGNPKEKPDGN